MEYKDLFDALSKDINTLKRNEEGVGKAVLMQNYRTAYESLLNKIRKEACDLLLVDLVYSHDFKNEEYARDSVRNFTRQVRNILTEEADTLERALYVLFQTYDVYEFLSSVNAGTIYERVHYDAYAPYWLAHISVSNQTFMDNIHGYVWNMTDGAWMNGPFVTWGQRVLPPTEELIEAERLKWRSAKVAVA